MKYSSSTWVFSGRRWHSGPPIPHARATKLRLKSKTWDALSWGIRLSHARCRLRRTRLSIVPRYKHDRACSSEELESKGGWIRDLTEEGIEPNPGPRYISKNINGLSDPRKAKQTFMRLVKDHRVNPITAVFLQEHNIKAADKKAFVELARDFELILALSPCPDNTTKGGTAIIIPRSALEVPKGSTFSAALAKLERSIQTVPSGRISAVTMPVEGSTTKLISAYAPAQPGSRPNFFSVTLAPIATKNSIMGIDANCVPNEALDLKRVGHTPYDNAGAAELAQVIAQNELADIARECLGQDEFYTSHQGVHGGTTHTRIDQLYAPTRNALTWSHVPVADDLFPRKEGALQLDHDMIEITVCEITQKRGKDIQSIDESIYEDLKFTTSLRSTIAFCIEVNTPDSPDGSWKHTWSKVKQLVSNLSIQETQKKRRQKNATLKPKIQRRDTLKQAVESGSADAAQMAEYAELSREIHAANSPTSLHDNLEEIAYSMGKKHDTGSAAFYRQYNSKGAATWVAETKEADWTNLNSPTFSGRTITDPKEVGNHISKYWKALFARQPTLPGFEAAREECLTSLRQGNRVLHPTDERCGAPITIEEVLEICNSLPTGKSAGPDRIPNKFYKVFSKFLAPILTELFNECHVTGSFPDDFAAGIVTTLYKKKDRTDPRNYRPITLLNCDYKILARILAVRMNEAVRQFASPQQNGFTPDSFLPENIMLLKLLQSYLEEEQEDAYFIFLDMEKAFDRCSWEFLMEALPALGFGDSFIRYIRLMYSTDNPPTRQLYVNGYLSQPFNIGGGVAQGCPLSPLLFLLITEPLTRMFQNNEYLQGVTVHGTRHLISQ